MRAEIARSVAVDLECALATKRAGMELGNVGHLVQIPKWEADGAARLSQTWWTVFNAEKGAEAAAASERLGLQTSFSRRALDFRLKVFARSLSMVVVAGIVMFQFGAN